MHRVVNQIIEILSNWARNAKVEISSQKSKLVILKGNMNARPQVIKYRNIRIEKVDSSPYLGIELDIGFTFLPDVKKQGTKARNVFGKMVGH